MSDAVDQKKKKDLTFRELVALLEELGEVQRGSNPLTQEELRRLYEKRPEQYAFLLKWLE